MKVNWIENVSQYVPDVSAACSPGNLTFDEA